MALPDLNIVFDIVLDKILASPFVVGLAGATAAIRGAPGVTWTERLINAGSGTLLAGFLTPAVASFFNLETPPMQNGIAFMLGLFGMNLTSAINDWIRSAKLSDVLPWVKKG